MDKIFIALKNITKRYPGVVALDNVNMVFNKGEIHAVMGENGAGKSTLIKVLSGSIQASEGTIIFEDREINHMNPILAGQLGIQVIYQELNLIDRMSVMDNIFAGIPISKYNFLVDKKEMFRKTEEVFKMMNIEINPNSIVGELSIAYQQMVEIAKALVRNPKLLIMDEPTGVLSNNEVEILFEVIKTLKKNGVTIIYISHRIDEIFAISDCVSILRDGKYINTKKTSDVTRKSLIDDMVGRSLLETYPKGNQIRKEKILEIKNICGQGFDNIAFDLYRGEVLGISGLVGAGRTEMAKGIFGAIPIYSGKIFLSGSEVIIKSPVDAIKNRIAYLSEDRKKDGLFLNLSVLMNIDITSLKEMSRYGIISRKKNEQIINSYIDKLGVKTSNIYNSVSTLSGGNQQKVVISKWLLTNSDIFIFDEPTRGIDVGAKQEIYNIMRELSNQGKAIIMITSDMEELLGMSDRICVMYEGKTSGHILEKDEFNEKIIMQYASGIVTEI